MPPTVPGPESITRNPVIDDAPFGLKPRSCSIMVGPVFSTLVAARTPKSAADPIFTGACAADTNVAPRRIVNSYTSVKSLIFLVNIRK